MTSRRGRRSRWAAAAGVLLGAVVVLGVAALPLGQDLAALAERHVPARSLGSPKLRRVLLRGGRIALQPASGPALLEGCPDVDIAAAGSEPEDPSAAPAQAWRQRLPGAPLLSLYLDPCHRQRLAANPQGHGRAFEEVGWLSFFDGGQARFHAAVGVRVHGGASRRRWPPSLRLYFADRYSPEGLPAELLSPDLDGALGSVILNRDEARDHAGRRWLFVEAINYDVARRLGLRVPHTRPVLLTENGESPRVVVLTEHPGSEMLHRLVGHDQVDWLRIKEEPGSSDSLERDRLLALIRDAPAPLTEAWARRTFDLDTLTAWTVATIVCGTGEPFQAVMFRDRGGRLAGGRWSWVLWDLDQSFYRRFDYQRDAVGILFSRRHAWIPAGLLIQRLLAEDPGFRRRLGDRTLAALRNELTSAFFVELVAGYRLTARRLGVEDLRFLDLLDQFFARRRMEVPAEIERHLTGS